MHSYNSYKTRKLQEESNQLNFTSVREICPKSTMDLFYKFDQKSNSSDFKVQIKNVQIIDLYKDEYENERKADKLKYFKEPKLGAYPLNLNEGFKNYRFRKINVMYGNNLNKIIKWHMKQNLSNTKCKENYTFNVYTHRQALINIIFSHYNKQMNTRHYDWKLYAAKFGNNVYIYCENDENRKPSDEDIYHSYHYKLEQMLFSDSPNEEPKTQEPVDENIRLNGIYRCQLGKFNLIYTAEVQGIISDEEIKDLNNLDLLNKCRFVNTKVASGNRYKNPSVEIKKYFQNHLANVDVTYYGIRDPNGYVLRPLKPCLTSDMCMTTSWNSKEYEQLLNDFLSLIVDKMSRVNSFETTYEFKYCARNKAVFYKIHEGQTEKSFLPADYIKFMKQYNK